MKKIIINLTLLAFLLAAALQPALAQEPKPKTTPVKLLLGAALELGGDRVAEVFFTNGNKQSVRAGQGGSIAVGAQFQFNGVEKLLLRGTIGYKYVTTAADNAHIRLSRIPIQATANWMAAKKLRLGAGLSMHRNIRFRADGIGPDMDFNGATGPVFELAYSGIGLSYTAMNYTDQAGNSYSANCIGLTFSLTVPNK